MYDRFRSLLLAEKAAILAHARNNGDLISTGATSALEDQVALLHEQFIAIRQRSSEFQKLKKVDAALLRIDNGEFGTCLECEKAIAVKRLLAVPWASHCVECQEQIIERSVSGETAQLDGVMS
jgi:DnaK suppressor protein